MNVDSTGNSADDRANETMDGDGMPDTADGDGEPDTADTMDADVLEIITQTSTFPESIAPNAEQLPSAESELPPEDPPIVPEVTGSAADAHPPLVIEYFPHGSPGAPINSTRGSSIYETSQEVFGGSVWAPFQSESDWDFAHWAKMSGSSASALADLLAIPHVRPPFFFFIALLNVV
jgi:hypothetical protein